MANNSSNNSSNNNQDDLDAIKRLIADPSLQTQTLTTSAAGTATSSATTRSRPPACYSRREHSPQRKTTPAETPGAGAAAASRHAPPQGTMEEGTMEEIKARQRELMQTNPVLAMFESEEEEEDDEEDAAKHQATAAEVPEAPTTPSIPTTASTTTTTRDADVAAMKDPGRFPVPTTAALPGAYSGRPGEGLSRVSPPRFSLFNRQSDNACLDESTAKLTEIHDACLPRSSEENSSGNICAAS